MAGKPGFMMYHDVFHALEGLEDASFKRVLCAACAYSETGEISGELDCTEAVVFGLVRSRLDADWEKYNSRVEAGRRGGQKSAEARASNFKQTQATSSKRKQTQANEPTITVTPTITVAPTITPTITTGNSSNSYAAEEEIPPDIGEVREYIREHGLGVSAEEFLARCEAAGWTDGNGQPVKNWKMWLKGYAVRTAMPDAGHGGRTDPRLAALEAMKGGAYK